MSVPSPSLDDFFQIEKHVEDGFTALLSTSGIQAVPARFEVTLSSPFVSIGATGLEPVRHQKILADGDQVWDAYSGTLTTDIVTRRPDDPIAVEHRRLLGIVRKSLQMFWLVPRWRKYQDIVLITDIREQPGTRTFDDEKNTDTTSLPWSILFNFNPEAWPVSLGDSQN